MSKLTHALNLAALGFHIFPLREDSKLPLIKDFPNKATRDPEQIRSWWVDPVLEIEHDYNIGISTTRFGDDEALIVIDVDNKGEKKGNESLEELEILGNDIPPTRTQFTPTGGRHLIYRHKEALKQGVNTLGTGLDIRSKGGYIVAAGSTIGDDEYFCEHCQPPAQAPEWLISALGKAPEKSAAPAPENINTDTAIDRAIYYLENEAPTGTSGERNQVAYRVAAKIKDFGVDQTEALSLISEYWDCEPMLDSDELEHVVASAYKYGIEPVGSAAPEAHFEPLPEDAETIHYLKQMNEEYALVLMEGTYFIIHETVDEKGKPKRVFMNEVAFKRKFSPFTLQKRGTWATEWLDWKGRREYRGVCFAPGREARNNYYNLWRGFTVEPLPYENATPEQRKGFDMFISHCKENVCRGDETLFNWLMTWFAHLIQKPYERPLTTLVLRGSKGVGKNAPIDRIGKLFEDHYKVVHNSRYLTSNFNGHMDSCLCLVLDEAFWSGDKDAEGLLKGLTTSPTITIERKGKEPYEVENLQRLVIIGNEDWLVPASTDERRYAVLDVGEGKKQNRKFFHDMKVLLDEKGGNRILLHYLQNYDIDLADINDIPKTSALLDQKLSSLGPFEQWWFDCLSQGHLVNADFGEGWEEIVEVSRLRQGFIRTLKERNIRSRVPDERSLGKTFAKLCPGASKFRKRVDGDRAWVYRLPELGQARKEWESFIGQPVKWEG